MTKFMDEDFLLTNNTAKELFHDYAEKMPIIDYHCHINPKEIAEDIQFENITKAWLDGDHYKWRAIRSNGVDEKYITGNDSSDKEKFMEWAKTIPKAIGNPLYHWTHLELQKYFDIYEPLCEKTAESIWERCNKKLNSKTLSVRQIIMKSNVKVICTTDDPIDDLCYHKQIAKDNSFKVKVLPAFRPDKAVNIEKDDFLTYIDKLSNTVGYGIDNYDKLCTALKERLDYFCQNGCKVSDHGLNKIVCLKADLKTLNEIFQKKRKGEKLSFNEVEMYQTGILTFLAKEYHKRDIVMQFHYGVIRNTNRIMFQKIGADTGFDCMSSENCGARLVDFLDMLYKENTLPKTILYSLNPNDNEYIGTVIGCFQGTEVQGKIQHGSAWWFNDNKTGMEKQLISLANLSLLGNFIGMLTDSRSFLSYTRHEYFRRILCNFIGNLAENGECPNDIEYLGKVVQDICYNNALEYFDFSIS